MGADFPSRGMWQGVDGRNRETREEAEEEPGRGRDLS